MVAICFNVNAQLVVKVIDGDTYKVLINGKLQNVRLQNVDAPELGQCFGKNIKDSVTILLQNKVVKVVGSKTDLYGRLIAKISIKGMSLDSLLIAKGWAWFYTKYSKQLDLKIYENIARQKGLGTWQCPEPVPP